MATGGLNAFRQNAVYMGGAKQSAWGTGVVPTWYWYWLDGSDANPQDTIKTEMEGDSSGYESLTWRSGKYEVIKIVEYARPMIAGYALQSLLGTGSDTYTAPTANTTLAANIVAGATSCQVVGNLGNTGTVTVGVTAAYGVAGFEIVTLDLTTKTGTGPFTYTLAAAATFKLAHTSGDAVVSQAGHALTPKFATFDPYSIEVGWNTDGGTLQQAFRYVDAVCTQLDIESAMGNKVKFTSTWWATQVAKLGAFQSARLMDTLLPFTHSDASGLWQLNGAATLNALTIEQFKLSLKRGTNATDFQTEGVAPTYFLPGNITIDGSYQCKFNAWDQYYLTYFGSNGRAPLANVTDVSGGVITGTESYQTTWQLDAINSLKLNLPVVSYSAAQLPMRLDGRAVAQPVTFKARVDRPSGVATALTATLNNWQVGAY